MPDATLINRASLSQQIKDALLDRILSGSLKPGERLIELKIANEMQTSQAPVREALRELEAIGLIETRHNRGARVRVIDEHELAEIYGVRAELEALAGELAARHAPEVGQRLEKIVVQMERAAERGSTRTFSELNSQFHSTIVEASGNKTLLGLWQGLNVRSRTVVNVSRSAADLVKLAASHRAIIDAIASGDGACARDVSWRHVRDNAPVPAGRDG